MKRFIALFILVIICAALMETSGCKKPANGPINLSQTVVTTLAGPGNISIPVGVAVDSAGYVYVADQGDQSIEKISPAGVVTTLAGSSGNGYIFYSVDGITVDVSGNVFVADGEGNKILKIEQPTGVGGSIVVTALASNLLDPEGIGIDTLDHSTTVYVSNDGNDQIEDISASGLVTFVAGNGGQGAANGADSLASFNYPQGMAVDNSGNVYVADRLNNMIRMISPFAIVSTYAGNGAAGSANGDDAITASFNLPSGVAVDMAGNVYVADAGNNLIRKITPAGVVTWLAGTSQMGSANGLGSQATFNNPQGIAVDAQGNVYVADTGNGLIRKITQ